jgi:hypothetical protein
MGEAYEPRAGCPINATIEVFGDRWSLLVLRDIVFGDRRYFRQLQVGSEEGIAKYSRRPTQFVLAAVTSSTITPAKCGRRMPSSTKPGHDKHTPSCGNGLLLEEQQA